MEAIEASTVEAAVLWLAQTILANLLVGKLDEWLRQVGLANDTQMLRTEIERVEMVVSAGKGRAVGHMPLARSLARLKERLYDADDVVDELDYYMLQQQIEEVTLACTVEPESTNGDGGEQADESRANTNAGMLSSSDLRLRSEAWKDFRIAKVFEGKPVKAVCIHCGTTVRCETSKGTSVLRNHIKSVSCKRKRPATEQTTNLAPSIGGATDSVSRKRTRPGKELSHNTVANKRPWDKAGFSNTIQQIARQLQDIRLELNEFHNISSAISNHYQNTTSYPCLRTSSLAPRKVYGRKTDKDYIIRVMRAVESDTLTVLPIVGMGGVGKTALAQLVYNDPTVKDQYERVWSWVSNDFDEVIVTRNMLDFFSQENHKRISNYAKLQEILKGNMEHRTKRFLLILDDVWNSMDYYRWNELLAPLRSSPRKGNMIIVTTRNLFLAQRIGTVKPRKLGALKKDDVWSLLKAFAFGDDDYKGNQTLEKIGRQIVKKLKGSPLAAETAGNILRKHLTADHWNNILKNEDWKSLQHSRGIMPSLKLSYDQLPYELQQCFLYCSIFPYNYQFVAEDLIYIWISLGFVQFNNSSKIEDTGRGYLTELVGSGFFDQVNTEGSQICRVMMPALMHDFARLVSGTVCAVIDSVECNEIPSTIHHLSILTDSAYNNKYHPQNIHRNEKFEEKLQSVITSVIKLRTLLLIGKCDHFFLQSFQHILEKAKYLRMLQISSRCASFDDAFLPNLVTSTHIRYLKVVTKGGGEALYIPTSKFYHLEVLDAKDAPIPNHMGSLVSMRRLFVKKGAHSSITGIDETNHPQESHNATDQHSGCFEIRQLQSMNRLVHLGIFQLGNVNIAEADGAKVLRDKQHLEKLQLSWKDKLLEDEYDNEEGSSQMSDSSKDTSYEDTFFEHSYEDTSISDSNNSPSSRDFVDTASDVLECLEPHHNLKYLQVSGYSGATSPSWLANSVTSLRALHLEDCGEWEILPSLESLPFLIKLELANMKNVIEVSIPSLEELTLFKLPKLELCSCNSVMDLSSSLRVLKINYCHGLKSFPLFESCEKFNIEQKSWLSRLDELTILDCSQLKISNHLPPSSIVSKISIRGVFEFPDMWGSPDKKLTIESGASQVAMLDDKSFAYHNLRMLTNLSIGNQNRVYIPFQGFRQLVNLKYFQIYWCKEIFSSHAEQNPTDEYMAAANGGALPSLRLISVSYCGVVGKWLSVLLRHVKAVDEFRLHSCEEITALSIEEDTDEEVMGLTDEQDRALQLLTSLRKLGIFFCGRITRLPEHLPSSLEELEIADCSQELSEQCRMLALATSKLKVKIDGKYMS